MVELLPEIGVMLAASAVVTLAFTFLYFEERERYLLVWAFGWGASTIRYLFGLLLLLHPENPSIFILNQTFALSNAVLLFWGTFLFLERRFNRLWMLTIPAGVLLLTIGVITDASFKTLTLPLFLFSGFVYIYLGSTLLRSSSVYGPSRIVAGIAAILWGLHKFDYPFLREHESLAMWGFLIAATIELIFAFAVFLTILRKNYNRLSEQGQTVRLILNNARDAIFHVINDNEQTLDFISPSCEKILGYKADEFYSNPNLIAMTIHPDDRNTLDTLIRSGDSPEAPVVLRGLHKDGRTIWIELSITFVKGEDGKVESYEGILRDITPRRQIEEQLRHSQKMEAIGLLAGGIAHDFNNLLTAISGHTDLARLTLGSDHPALRDMDEITRATGRASDLTRQLLAYSRKQTMRLQVFNPNDTLRSLESMLRRLLGEHIKLDAGYAEDLWSVRSDPSQIEQVIINLAVNARDAMPEGGKLTIRTGNAVLLPDAKYPSGPTEKGDYVMISVSDTGTGITAEDLQRIFDPFFTTKDVGKGTGLGLSTVFGIIQQSNGHIRVASQLGEGSEFRAYFPKVEEEIETRETIPAMPTKGNNTGTESILLVEDNETVREMAARVLREHGYTVETAGDGRQGLKMIETGAVKVDLIVADVVMPEMGGVELATQVLKRAPDTRLLFISGYTAERIHNPVVGSIPLLSKPFRAEELASKVRLVLDAPVTHLPEL
ncbi:response regulator [bacterium]|nr:response regulator [bacterium]